ncbi:MAG: ZIP family metal transporter [Candidatus Nealsonbacteria bacterium]|nr:ZIP family metal transporter [Candidatus Nealsonbacteria bacterium]
MNTLFYIIIATFFISLLSFVGALILFLKEKILNKIILILVAFSSGALIGGAFLHLIPESLEQAGTNLNVFLFVILGFCAFFILESLIHWHHHHAKKHPGIMPFSYLILVSDTVHNFIDGLIIAAAFVVSLPVGLVTTLVIVLHEIPQELGDFAVLVYGGVRKSRALLLNFISALSAVLGGVVGFFFAAEIGKSAIYLLPFAAGTFIYIAASDLIPEIKQKAPPGKAVIHFFVFLLGVAFMLLIKLL